MTELQLIEKVRNALGASAFSDATIAAHIDEVKNYMLSAGVNTEDVESDSNIGVIIRGVADLWNISGGAKLSDYFRERVNQLAAGNGVE